MAGSPRPSGSDLKQVPCVALNDLSDEQLVALRAADNRVGELSGWDPDLLASDLRAAPEELRIGWDPAELDVLIGELQGVKVPEIATAPPAAEPPAEPPAEPAHEQDETPPQHAVSEQLRAAPEPDDGSLCPTCRRPWAEP